MQNLRQSPNRSCGDSGPVLPDPVFAAAYYLYARTVILSCSGGDGLHIEQVGFRKTSLYFPAAPVVKSYRLQDAKRRRKPG